MMILIIYYQKRKTRNFYRFLLDQEEFNIFHYVTDNIYSETLFGPLSPIVYDMPQNKKEMLEIIKGEKQNKITIIKGEDVIALEYYFTRG